MSSPSDRLRPFAVLLASLLTLAAPLAVFAIAGRFPIGVAAALDLAAGVGVFRFARADTTDRVAVLRTVADLLWGVWSFLGIVVLFGSTDVLQGLDLKSVVSFLRRWPIVFGLIANGLLSTAAIRIALAAAALCRPATTAGVTKRSRPPL